MPSRYNISLSGRSVEMSKPNSTILVYKIPYADIQNRRINIKIENPFIVYILHGKNDNGKDAIYVGKSKNGITNRPTSHKDKYSKWTTCYVLTQFKERTFFNDGSIQYLENELCRWVNDLGTFNNTTITTTTGTANVSDEDNCNDYITEALQMLFILGLDLKTGSEEEEADLDIQEGASAAENRKNIPDGIYTMARKIKRLDNLMVTGTMEVSNGKFILKAGSDVVEDVGSGLAPNVEIERNNASIENGKLMEDVELNSPSACGEFIVAAACNGWTSWANSDGRTIDIYRQ